MVSSPATSTVTDDLYQSGTNAQQGNKDFVLGGVPEKRQELCLQS